MTKICIIGAASARFGLGTIGDILKVEALHGATIALHDIDGERLSEVATSARGHAESLGAGHVIEATTDRKAALANADFCIVSIEVGPRFKFWDLDWQVPQQFGARQCYGENGGPGGVFHALRLIPHILDICADIESMCPSALILNYSNPMNHICHAVHEAFPDLNFYGLCHEISSFNEHVPAILGQPLDELRITSAGLNHFAFLLDVRYSDGRDAYPDLRSRASDYFANAQAHLDELETRFYGRPKRVRPRDWTERRLFKVLLEEYGYLPVTVDSHLGEFVHWSADVVDHAAIMDFYQSYKTSGAWSRSEDPALRLAKGTDVEDFWRAVPIIAALVSGETNREPAVVMRNNGAVSGWPLDFVVEVPARIGDGVIAPENVGPLPRPLEALMTAQIGVHRMTAEAAITKSRQAVLHALLADPFVTGYRAATQMLDAMISLQAPHLDYLG